MRNITVTGPKPELERPTSPIARKEQAEGFVVWFTGLPGAGKSTIAQALAPILREAGLRVEVLDGDEVRQHLSKGLGFSKEDRDTNIRRIGYVAKLLARNGVVVLVAAVSPYRDSRAEVKSWVKNFVEVHVSCPLDELMRRDPKGLYAKAIRGEIANFTGVSDPYEPPLSPEIVIETDKESVQSEVRKLMRLLEDAKLVSVK
jgi:adenylylsulfate kinase